VITFDTSILLGYYQSKTSLAALAAGAGASATPTGTTSTNTTKVPTAPWSPTSDAERESDLTKDVMAGKRFINESAAKLDVPGASDDYKKLFALYQGLNSLYGVVDAANGKNVSGLDLASYMRTFARGVAEVDAYADTLKLDQLRLTRGDASTSAKTSVGVPKGSATYTTDPIYSGDASGEVPALQGDVNFKITVKRLNVVHDIDINLNDMGSTPRTMSNVTSFINGKLADEGLKTKFAVVRTPGEPKTITAGKTTVTLPAGADSFAFQVKGDTTEQVTFSAQQASPAVYVSSVTGNPDPDKDRTTNDAVLVSQVTKLNADTAGIPGSGSKIYSDSLEGTIGTVRASKTGADGSVYMIADVQKTVSGQTVTGDSDTALLKFDSAGHLLYTRTLGASDTATGYALDVSANGQVAVAGSVTGVLNGATNGALNSSATSGSTDSFVTLYNASGDEVWTERRGGFGDDQATAVAVTDDGTVYVGGRTKSTIPGGQTPQGGYDAYLTAYSTSAAGKPVTLFTQSFGTTADDSVTGLVVNGDQVITAGSENGHAVLRSFDVSLTSTTTTRSVAADGTWTQDVTTTTGGSSSTVTTTGSQAASGTASTSTKTVTTAGAATAGAVRDLGDLQGGTIAGLALDNGELYIGGSTRNGALGLGTPTTSYSGGLDGFAAQLSTDLASTADDVLTYVGGSADDTVTGMAAAGGKVWLTGAAGEGLGGAAVGTKDGYVSQVDLGGGTVDWTQRITGKDGYATPSAISVSATGASALDKLGLPSGTLSYTASTSLVSATGVRAGDTFQITSSDLGVPTTITIAANETLESLQAKILRATGYKAKVSIVSDGANRRLSIAPATDSAVLQLIPGKDGADALSALGLPPGIIRNTTVGKDGSIQSADGKGNVYGLDLTTPMDLSTADGRTAALSALSDAMTQIRNAYRDLQNAAKPTTAANNLANVAQLAAGAPAYLTAQTANFQAALNRLGGGG
jgi:hypothetical protein